MRRKSERTATKKSKTSPEKKEEKSKRTRTRRRKQSSSSENESHDEESPVREVESVAEPEKNQPQTPAKEDHLEEAQDQIWRVKTSQGDVGEIQKLKICLTRPPSTPERIDRSPRSKRKHSRATSSSDTPSVEGMDEKKEKKTKHRKRTVRDKDDSEKNDSHGEDQEEEVGREAAQLQQESSSEISQTDKRRESLSKNKESPKSTTIEDDEGDQNVADSSQKGQECVETSKDNESQEKTSDADTTTVSPNEDTKDATPVDNTVSNSEEQGQSDFQSKTSTNVDIEDVKNSERKRTISAEKSEVLEIHAEESKCESSDNEVGQSNEEHKEDSKTPQEERASEQSSSMEPQVSKSEEVHSSKSKAVESSMAINEHDVVESSNTSSKETKEEKTQVESDNKIVDVKEKGKVISDSGVHHKVQNSDSVQSKHESVINGQPTPVVSRKRRWGSRSSKLTTQKSITISTDILKDIIPDVKPVEFDEVIEERKHKREREVTEKVYRPILPKIVIDNTENIEKKKDPVDKEKEAKPRDLASNRKISIIKDNDSIITRPPSPPRNKQSCILYITNLVRPFTLTQLKNLLQRTGKIVENGFWIDRIKSKCFVQYESEDHAVETRHALHGVTWPVSNPKTLQVDFSTEEAFEKAKTNEEADTVPVSKPGTVEDWLREQDTKRERGELEQLWERKTVTREWDLGKNEKDKDKEKVRLEERPVDKRRRRSPEKTPEPARKFKKKEEEAPAKLLDDLFRKTKATPCIYWLPLSAETIAIKEEQRRQHMAEHERRLQELRRTHRRH